MSIELMLNFPNPTQVAVHIHILDDEYADMTSVFAFVNPITNKDMAAWLTHAGIPGVLAMTHSVLVTTAGLLFARFYRSLFRGDPVGKALDDARAALYFDPKRGKRLRGFGGNQSVTLELHDWFLPALYQTGPNRPLLNKDDAGEVPKPDQKDNLPKMQESGFFGRTIELWRIERAFTVQGTRRFSITGFGGQGKTYLALETGYWLLRTRLFARVCFVSFSGFQGVDPVGVTVSTLATVLDKSLPDTNAAEQALKRIPTLLILDNLETLFDGDGLPELLTAATRWSEAGDTRVLLTSRQPNFNHPDYPTAGSFRHQSLHLKGLGEQDSLDWFGELMRLPPEPKFGMPKRRALLSLFQQVDFHPLSIGLLAQQLKERRPAELGERLKALLEEQPADREDRTLLASLELSLERLPERCREWLPRLGVFQGGGLEVAVGKVTALAETEENQEIAEIRRICKALQTGDAAAIISATRLDVQLTPDKLHLLRELGRQTDKATKIDLVEDADESSWPILKEVLCKAGLMQIERLVEIDWIWLRFHPTLTPALWQRLSEEEQVGLTKRHWKMYYMLSGELNQLDRMHPDAARAIVRIELPNMLRAVHAALQAGAEEGQKLADNVNRFLYMFGMQQERQALIEMVAQLRETTEKEAIGSQAWFLARSNLGQQLQESGQAAAAEAVFQEILAGLGKDISYQRCVTLHMLGRCREGLGRPTAAERLYVQELAELARLEQNQGVQRQTAATKNDLANVLIAQGQYKDAQESCQAGLEISEKLSDKRGMSMGVMQLGTFALMQGELTKAAERYQEALAFFRSLGEPASEAVAWHQLGLVHQKAKNWEEAEQAYRQSARLKEEQGGYTGNNGAAASWGQLAILCEELGRLAEAEQWFRKALAAFQDAKDWPHIAAALSNLAILLAKDSARLDEALSLAEEKLAIDKTFDPAVLEIWNTYGLLARIASQQGDNSQASVWRAESRHTYLAFSAWRQQLQPYKPLIVAVVQGGDVETALARYDESVVRVKDVIYRVLSGERDEAVLCEPLNFTEAAIIHAILEGLAGQLSTKKRSLLQRAVSWLRSK